MNKRILAGATALVLFGAAPAFAQSAMSGSAMSSSMSKGTMKTDPMVGGAAMYANKSIVANAVNSPDHTTLVSLVKKAGLVDALMGPGPFTVFAPTNAAFAKIPSATLTAVGNDKALLTKVLTYHVVAGSYDTAKLAAAIAAGGGSAVLPTLNGETLVASMEGPKFVLSDEHGGKSYITVADVYQSNGVIQVVDSVLMP
jgi:uncharacterized surface protein with fasciclin (FAS1) repeats